MNNEEKILELLVGMQGKMDSLQSQMDRMEGRMGSLEKNVSDIRLDIENRMDPALQVLAEGQASILEKVAPMSRVEALEDKVNFLETVVLRITRDVEELKKAQ